VGRKDDELFEEGLQDTAEEFYRRAGGLMDDLEAAGYPRDSAFAYFVNSPAEERYDDAIPILIDWLPRIDDEWVRDAIVRALTVPWGGPEVEHALARELRRPASGELRALNESSLKYIRRSR
jgi:hypothetical protein